MTNDEAVERVKAMPQQEVDPVRGLVEALEPFVKAADERPWLSDDNTTMHAWLIGGSGLTNGDLLHARQAYASYRAWEEGGGSDSAGRSGRPQEAPPATLADLERAWIAWLTENPNRNDSRYAEAFVAGFNAAPPASAPPEGWRPVSELKPEIGHVVVRHEVSYRWAPYKPDGQRQMKKPGRWQRATEYGWENADLPEGSLFIPASDHPRLSAAPPPPAGVDRPETEGEVVHPDMRGKIEAAIWEVVDRLKKRHGPLWFDMHTPGLMARAILALSQPVPARGEEGVG